MGIFKQQLPEWRNSGGEPPAAKKASGWQAGEKPPASWFNWLFNKNYECIKEIRDWLTEQSVSYCRWPAYVCAESEDAASYIVNMAENTMETYEDGQIFFICFSRTNKGTVTLNFNGLGEKGLLRNSGQTLSEGDIVSGYIYNIVYFNGGFRLLNTNQKFSGLNPPYTSDCFKLLMDGIYLVNSSAVINTPHKDFNQFGGNFVLYVRRLPGLNQIWQYAVSMNNFAEFDMILNTNGEPRYTTWRQTIGTDGRNMTFNADLFQEDCGKGFALTFNGLTAIVGSGTAYIKNYGAVRSAQAVSFTLESNARTFIYIQGDYSLMASREEQSDKTKLYTLTTNETAVTGIVKNLKEVMLVPDLKGVTQSKGVANKTLATTEFVDIALKNAVIDISQVAGFDGLVAWDEITGKPETYPPSVHKHSVSDIDEIVTSVDGNEPDANGNVDVVLNSRYNSHYYDGSRNVKFFSILPDQTHEWKYNAGTYAGDEIYMAFSHAMYDVKETVKYFFGCATKVNCENRLIDLFSFDTTTNKYKKISTSSFDAKTINKYAVSGSSTVLNTVYQFHHAVLYKNMVYSLNTADTWDYTENCATYFDTGLSYNMTTNTWKTISLPMKIRSGVACAYVENHGLHEIWMLGWGGYNYSSAMEQYVQRYDLDTGGWNTMITGKTANVIRLTPYKQMVFGGVGFCCNNRLYWGMTTPMVKANSTENSMYSSYLFWYDLNAPPVGEFTLGSWAAKVHEGSFYNVRTNVTPYNRARTPDCIVDDYMAYLLFSSKMTWIARPYDISDGFFVSVLNANNNSSYTIDVALKYDTYNQIISPPATNVSYLKDNKIIVPTGSWPVSGYTVPKAIYSFNITKPFEGVLLGTVAKGQYISASKADTVFLAKENVYVALLPAGQWYYCKENYSVYACADTAVFVSIVSKTS